MYENCVLKYDANRKKYPFGFDCKNELYQKIYKEIKMKVLLL